VTTCIVLLRGINVGGNNRVPMAELRDLLTSLGARNVATYLQSGQAVVDVDDADAVDVGGLAARVEAALTERLGLQVRALVRTADELEAVVAANPYPERVATPKQLHVVFLDAAPDPATVADVGTRFGEDEFTVGDTALAVLYLSYSGRSIDSPMNKAVAKLKGLQTARNWTTVQKLQDLCRARG
jgi:uncharacterized protein (DUF1697 family)